MTLATFVFQRASDDQYLMTSLSLTAIVQSLREVLTFQRASDVSWLPLAVTVAANLG